MFVAETVFLFVVFRFCVFVCCLCFRLVCLLFSFFVFVSNNVISFVVFRFLLLVGTSFVVFFARTVFFQLSQHELRVMNLNGEHQVA